MAGSHELSGLAGGAVETIGDAWAIFSCAMCAFRSASSVEVRYFRYSTDTIRLSIAIASRRYTPSKDTSPRKNHHPATFKKTEHSHTQQEFIFTGRRLTLSERELLFGDRVRSLRCRDVRCMIGMV